MTGQSAEAPAGARPLNERLRDVATRYQCALERNPRDPEALAGMSLVALASGQPEAAVLLAARTVLVAPGMGPAWVVLGQARRAQGRQAEAANAYRAALRIDGMDPLARLGLGEVKLASNARKKR